MTDRDAIMDGLARYARGVDARSFVAVAGLGAFLPPDEVERFPAPMR